MRIRPVGVALFHAGKHDENIAAYLWAKMPEVIKYNRHDYGVGEPETQKLDLADH